MKIAYKTLLVTAFAGILLAFASCKKDDPPQPEYTHSDSLKAFIKGVMADEKWYLWIDSTSEVNAENYDDPYNYFDALLYEKRDRWSYIADKQAFDQHYEEGKYTGLGLSMAIDWDGNLRVAFVFEDSPIAEEGVTRGYIIERINGSTAASLIEAGTVNSSFTSGSNTLEVRAPDGNTRTITVSPREIDEQALLHYQIDTLSNGEKVGYMVFRTFIKPALPALERAFTEFAGAQVSELVVDLRYNGGGALSVAKQLGNYIAGGMLEGKLFYSTQHNAYHQNQDTVSDNQLYFEASPLSLSLNSVVFIATGRTASASELLINGLAPHISTTIIGDDTHGKPVGMYVFDPSRADWDLGIYLLPITFKGVNAEGYGGFYGGLPADAQRPDGLDHVFGHPQEACYKEALYYLENGEFSAPVKQDIKKPYQIKMQGLRAEIGAW